MRNMAGYGECTDTKGGKFSLNLALARFFIKLRRLFQVWSNTEMLSQETLNTAKVGNFLAIETCLDSFISLTFHGHERSCLTAWHFWILLSELWNFAANVLTWVLSHTSSPWILSLREWLPLSDAHQSTHSLSFQMSHCCPGFQFCISGSWLSILSSAAFLHPAFFLPPILGLQYFTSQLCSLPFLLPFPFPSLPPLPPSLPFFLLL